MIPVAFLLPQHSIKERQKTDSVTLFLTSSPKHHTYIISLIKKVCYRLSSHYNIKIMKIKNKISRTKH